MEKENLRVWDEGDETTPPQRNILLQLTVNPNVPTPETEAEEI